ncbi:MAG: hypothetical protein V3U24_04815, partial [Candidatus Neomarinimicrobiota bacterium]
ANDRITHEYRIQNARYPLNVCYTQSREWIIWGDYARPKTPRGVNVYLSTDLGESWNRVYCFKAGAIRHVHNIVFDPFRDLFWVLTGDRNNEAGIWKTEDFSEVLPFLTGKQEYRAVSIIPTPTGLIIPTDTPSQRNYVQYYSFERERLEPLEELNGSALYCSKVKNWIFLSTAYEPSRINKHKFAELWGAKETGDWKQLLSFKKDFLPVRYFQYPVVKIPYYAEDYQGDFYYFSTRSVKGGSRVLIYRDSQLREFL